VRDDGTVYFSGNSDSNAAIYAIYTDGSMERVAGGGTTNSPNNVPALDADFDNISSMRIDDTNDRMFVTNNRFVFSFELDGNSVWIVADTGANNYLQSVAVNDDGSEMAYAYNAGYFLVDMTTFPPGQTTSLTLNPTQSTNCTGFADKPYVNTLWGLTYAPDGLIHYLGYSCTGVGSALYESIGTVDMSSGAYTRLNSFTHSVKNNIYYGADGYLYYLNEDQHTVMRYNGGIPEVVAGNGTDGSNGDNGPATDAQLNDPASIALTPEGDIIIGDWGSARIRKVWMQ
jgi:hypothetical protein